MGRTMVAKHPPRNKMQRTSWQVIQKRADCQDTSGTSLLPGTECQEQPFSFQQFRGSLPGESQTPKLLTKPSFAGRVSGWSQQIPSNTSEAMTLSEL